MISVATEKGEAMRPVDGDKLIEWLDASLEDCINCKANTIAGITALNIDSFKRFIAEQPTIEPYGTWIPCSDCERKCEKWENSKT